MLSTLFYQEIEVFYDGSQLNPGWIEKKFGLKGDSLVSFTGGCDVKFEHMVDLEDLEQRNLIKSNLMLHFLGEFFSSSDLCFSLALQRILILLVKETLEELSREKLIRRGDDLFLLKKGVRSKLSISVATVSPVSSLFHLALNLTKSGTPVKVATLSDLGIDALDFAPLVMNKFSQDYESLIKKLRRVRKLKQGEAVWKKQV